MLFRVRYKDGGRADQEVEADEQAMDGDWLVLKRYLKTRGPLVVFRVKGDQVLTVELADAPAEVQKMTDGAAMGRLWALAAIAAGRSLAEARDDFPGEIAPAQDALRAVFDELAVPRDGRPDDVAKETATERLQGFHL